jgi:hypothetical protein
MKKNVVPFPIPVKVNPRTWDTAVNIRILFKPEPTEMDAETKAIALLVKAHASKLVKALEAIRDNGMDARQCQDTALAALEEHDRKPWG